MKTGPQPAQHLMRAAVEAPLAAPVRLLDLLAGFGVDRCTRVSRRATATLSVAGGADGRAREAAACVMLRSALPPALLMLAPVPAKEARVALAFRSAAAVSVWLFCSA